jgi:hypothetical protein
VSGKNGERGMQGVHQAEPAGGVARMARGQGVGDGECFLHGLFVSNRLLFARWCVQRMAETHAHAAKLYRQ